MREHRPHESSAGRGADHPRGATPLNARATLLLAASVPALFLAACGGDDGSRATATGASTTVPGSSATASSSTAATGSATASPSAAKAFKAQDAVPDLGALGYTIQQQGKDPASGGADVHRALFARANNHGAMIVIYNFPDAATAQTQYGALSEALKNPPPDFVGAKATFVDSASPPAGEERKGYVTATPDGQGNKVWTDIYRSGHVVVIVQLLDDGATDQLGLRGQVASAVIARVK